MEGTRPLKALEEKEVKISNVEFDSSIEEKISLMSRKFTQILKSIEQ